MSLTWRKYTEADFLYHMRDNMIGLWNYRTSRSENQWGVTWLDKRGNYKAVGEYRTPLITLRMAYDSYNREYGRIPKDYLNIATPRIFTMMTSIMTGLWSVNIDGHKRWCTTFRYENKYHDTAPEAGMFTALEAGYARYLQLTRAA